ncbi:MAG: GMC family oxidoreductase, partial [Methylobacteriaceae bacterium]|nr:GMC family oxidoreductase [Methylobacteriaceae bacterium]
AAMKLPGFELRPHAHVLRVNLTPDRRHATGVTYLDQAGEEVEQPADLVVLCAFAINNARLMLLSGIGDPYDPATGRGGVGRNFSYQTTSSVALFFPESVNINPFIGAGALAVTMDDFNSDNFDHGPHGFVGGAYVQVQVTGGAPIRFRPIPHGTPQWGLEWKNAVRRWYNHAMPIQITGSSMPSRASHLDLDPTYRDAYGQPLLRMTFDFTPNDLAMSRYVTAKAAEIGRAMGATLVEPAPRTGPFSVLPYQTTHLAGGTPLGADPRTSAVNRYGQSWSVPNVFALGSSVFPQNAAYNPTGTVGAFAYWAAAAVTGQYLRAPGRLLT